MLQIFIQGIKYSIITLQLHVLYLKYYLVNADGGLRNVIHYVAEKLPWHFSNCYHLCGETSIYYKPRNL